jgi:hypothetical protein
MDLDIVPFENISDAYWQARSRLRSIHISHYSLWSAYCPLLNQRIWLTSAKALRQDFEKAREHDNFSTSATLGTVTLEKFVQLGHYRTVRQ